MSPKTNSIRGALGRRGTEVSNIICQRCRRFEVDLTNTSDDLTATDGELKASRQVISLLQRQLELFRVEKEGLERLIISQSNNPELQLRLETEATNTKSDCSLIKLQASEQPIDIPHEPPAVGGSSIDNSIATTIDFGATQKLLLKMIQTQLYAKDEEIVKLKFSLKEAQNDNAQLALQVHSLEESNLKLKSENSILSENLTLRDQTIVSLSNEVFQQGGEYNSGRRRQSFFDGQQSKSQQQIAQLTDTIDAYKKTNELLSTNVVKLTDRCTKAEREEIESRSQCHELEAKCCQIQSKLLSLLKEIEQSSQQVQISARNDQDSESSNQRGGLICSESVKLLIQRLLEDKSLDIPLSWKEGNKPNNKDNKNDNNSNLKTHCDELGFYIPAEELNNEKDNSYSSGDIFSLRDSKRTSARHQNYQNEISSPPKLATVEETTEAKEEDQCQEKDNRCYGKNSAHQMSVDDTKNDQENWFIVWDNFIKDFDKIDLTKSKEFKGLLRSGVPQGYRCKVWKALIDLKIGKERQQFGQDYYQSLLQPNRPKTSSKMSLNPSSKQIELDLLRTLPNNRHFETLDSSGTIRLRRVLIAYSEHNPKVGYCQGMNRLAAVALLVLPEEEAFWCLVTIIDHIMPSNYYNDLWKAQVDSSVVMDFVSIKMPLLKEHFEYHQVELSLFAWFLTIFVDGSPPALFLRLWDSFLYEGDKILFRVALALLRMHESDLLRLESSVAINNFLRSAVNAPMNIDKLFDIAFDWMNPLSTRSLRAKRQSNFELMRTGFENVSKPFSNPSPENSAEDEDLKDSREDNSPFEDGSIISI